MPAGHLYPAPAWQACISRSLRVEHQAACTITAASAGSLPACAALTALRLGPPSTVDDRFAQYLAGVSVIEKMGCWSWFWLETVWRPHPGKLFPLFCSAKALVQRVEWRAGGPYPADLLCPVVQFLAAQAQERPAAYCRAWAVIWKVELETV